MELTRLLARVKDLEIASPRLVDGVLAGNYRTAFRGPGLEFAEVRAYAEGDDPRHIDWNVTGRAGTPYTKTFREERERTVFLLVDLSPSVFPADPSAPMRESVDLLFSVFALAALQHDDRVGACFFTDRVERWVAPRRGRRHALSLIKDLRDAAPQGRGSDLGLALRASADALKHRGVVVVLSDFKADGYQRGLAALARRHEVIAVRMVANEELAFPHVGLVHLEDAETGRRVNGYGNSHAFRRAYRDFWLGRRKAWLREMRRFGVAALELRADEDPIARLSRFFERRRRMR